MIHISEPIGGRSRGVLRGPAISLFYHAFTYDYASQTSH